MPLVLKALQWCIACMMILSVVLFLKRIATPIPHLQYCQVTGGGNISEVNRQCCIFVIRFQVIWWLQRPICKTSYVSAFALKLVFIAILPIHRLWLFLHLLLLLQSILVSQFSFVPLYLKPANRASTSHHFWNYFVFLWYSFYHI